MTHYRVKCDSLSFQKLKLFGGSEHYACLASISVASRDRKAFL